MKLTASVGAAVGGLLGALVWAGVAYLIGLEIGYVAWIVGGLVGCGCRFAGGQGQAAGVSCAAIAVVAILCGKLLAFNGIIGIHTSQQIYQFLSAQTEDFSELKSARQYRNFMVEYGHTDAASAEAVPQQEVDQFTTTVAPLLKDLAEKKPHFVRWRTQPEVKAYVDRVTAQISTWGVVMANLDVIDIIFALFGVVTAYKVGLGTNVPRVPFPGAKSHQTARDEELVH